MSTRIVNVNEATVTIRSETRRAALHRARYLKALEADYPEVRDMTPLWYLEEKDVERRAIFEGADQFCTVLSRIVESTNAPLRLPQLIGEVLGHDDTLTAYAHYQDDDSGFWNALIDAVYEINLPITEPEKQPMSEKVLTEAVAEDPNSLPGGESGSAPTGTDSPNAPETQN